MLTFTGYHKNKNVKQWDCKMICSEPSTPLGMALSIKNKLSGRNWVEISSKPSGSKEVN